MLEAIIISSALSALLVIGSFLLSLTSVGKIKLDPYECGFEPFQDARQKLDIHYFLVALLFIVFDLEVVFLFPWTIAIPLLNHAAWWVLYLFVAILTWGLAFEWFRGGLEWQ